MIELSTVIQDIHDTFPDRSVCFATKDVPLDIVLPIGWREFGLNLGNKPTYPNGWSSFLKEFPSTITLFENCLLGTVLLLGAHIEMAYVFHDGINFYYYLGGTPIKEDSVETVKLKHLPQRLQDFYREVHDGYNFFPARSMGPQRICDQMRISELIDDDNNHFAKNWTTVFSNGGGDYVAVDSNSHDAAEGLIWWHEEPANPERGIDIFEVMDAWMAIFSEGIQPRERILSTPN
ncbi:hypothetical protein [Pseudomonas parafulva]|uniref:hypothetical protein n=1 Tax=Pseudomonas parafulva TaxID=157782 RepID=UPI000491A911|nr:hypothetical protein [Pseudomonas parafulva]